MPQQIIRALASQHLLKKDEKGALNLKSAFLIPLVLCLLGIIGAFIFFAHQEGDNDIKYQISESRDNFQRLFEEYKKVYNDSLESFCSIIKNNKALEEAFKRHDREALLRLGTPIYQKLNQEHEITHFYFHLPDKTNLLRIHQPDRFGDKIIRQSLAMAAASQLNSMGIELGPIGTLTLRHVEPWYDNQGNLIGYIELGLEVDHILRVVEKYFHEKVFLLIEKDKLDQHNWEVNMKATGRKAMWDLLPESAIVNVSNDHKIPAEFITFLQSGADNTLATQLSINHKEYAAIPVEATNSYGDHVGHIWILEDISQEVATTHAATLYAISMASALGLLLIYFFSRQLAIVENELDTYHHQLHLIASHDALTGLYNRISFDNLFHDEIQRASRHHRALSLLLIDVDHFKHINDTYGHPAGDKVLQELAYLLTSHLRNSDHLARYGGEEFALILPETDMQEALALAERLRRAADEQLHATAIQSTTNITISIGVASLNQQFNSSEKIIEEADKALYRAKRDGRNCVRHSPAGEG